MGSPLSAANYTSFANDHVQAFSDWSNITSCSVQNETRNKLTLINFYIKTTKKGIDIRPC